MFFFFEVLGLCMPNYKISRVTEGRVDIHVLYRGIFLPLFIQNALSWSRPFLRATLRSAFSTAYLASEKL